ncbi:MAG: HD domain-containing phosphohydrolase, partial [Nitrospirota bacterium]|nr:HD domain-containing phosphohydrolase [Nitrospirota bacterium]
LAGNWFSHPFSSSTFKITNQKDLDTLRALRNLKILFDPAQSDPLPPSDTEDDSVEDGKAPVDPSRPPTLENQPNDLSPDPNREDRQRAYAERREKLKKAEQAYQEVLKQNKVTIRDIKGGYARGIRKAEDLVTTLAAILENGALGCLMNLMDLNEMGEEFYHHSLNVCMLSMVVGQDLNLPQELVRMLGMGALFHDIGELEGVIGTFIPKGAKRTKEEQRIWRQHPQNGRKMLEKGFGVPGPSLEVITQHHERVNGTGFPDGLKGESIHLLAKIVMVADVYDDLCNNPQLDKSLTPHEALSTVYARRQDEFWEEAVLALIQNLGIYPPSSIVELSDGSIGMVCSINLLDRLRPTLMLYAPNLPRDEAIILDLSREPGLTIQHSKRPMDIPRQAWKYLNPRGMVSYFAFTPGPAPSSSTEKDQAPQA